MICVILQGAFGENDRALACAHIGLGGGLL